MLAQVSDDFTVRSRQRRPRRDLAAVLLLGGAGVGLVFLAARQGWAQVHIAAPKPLPPTVVTETGQDLAPAADALAVAALASLAAVLATRRMLRRITGVLLAGFGAGIAAAVGTGISTAHVLATASGGGGSGSADSAATGSAAAGSVTAGAATGSASGAVPVTGLPGHVVWASFPWHGLALAGAAAVLAAGVLVVWRAGRLPVMSSRFDRPGGTGRPGGPDARRGAGRGVRRAASRQGGGRPAGEAGRRGDHLGIAQPGRRPDRWLTRTADQGRAAASGGGAGLRGPPVAGRAGLRRTSFQQDQSVVRAAHHGGLTWAEGAS